MVGLRSLTLALALLMVLQPVAHAGDWVPTTPLSTPRFGLRAVVVADKLYVIGGHESDDVATFEVLDLHDGRWSVLAPLPTARNYPSCVRIGRAIYVVGGYRPGASPQASVLRYDLDTGVWTEVRPMPIANAAMACAEHAGKLYVFGGDQAMTAAYVYDPATDEWAVLPLLPHARKHAAAVAIGGLIYVTGGWALPVGTGNPIASVDIFDPTRNTWSSGPDLPEALGGLAAVAHGGRLWAIGGLNARDQIVAAVYTYRSGDAEWKAAPSLPEPLELAAVAEARGCIYTIGGFGPSGPVASAHELCPGSRRSPVPLPASPAGVEAGRPAASPELVDQLQAPGKPDVALRGNALPPAMAAIGTVGGSSQGVAIKFELARPGDTELKVYDLLGRGVASLRLGHLRAGAHVFNWDGRAAGGESVPPGGYFCEIHSDEARIQRKITVLR